MIDNETGKIMKKYTLVICSFLLSILFIIPSQAQEEKDLRWLDIELANYAYPHPVKYLHLNVQNQELKLAYMDINPENANGKTSCSFMAKILMALIGEPPLKH